MKQIKRYVKIVLVLIGAVCLFQTTLLSLPKSFADHKDLSSTLYQYERYLEEERYDNAYTLLTDHKQHLTELFSNLENDYIQDELNKLLVVNLNTVAGDTFTKKHKLKNAHALVLAVDAINHPDNPVWVRWKLELDQSLQSIIDSGATLSEEEKDALLTNWEIISPAIALTIDQSSYNQLNYAFQKFSQSDTIEEELQQLEAIYHQSKAINTITYTEVNDSMSFMWMVIIVGGFILFTLSYVGWKKYKGEKDKQRKQRSN